MPYWQLFYHLVWSTKHRAPLLTPEVEREIYGSLRKKAIGLRAHLFSLNGVEDHIHMVVAIPPNIAVARFVGQVKAAASAQFNKSRQDGEQFFWQAEYGAFSFDRKRLPNHIAYVERQKEHHAQRTTIPILERTTGGDVKIIHELPEGYYIEDAAWRRELETLEV